MEAIFLACITWNATLHVRTFNLPLVTCLGRSAWCSLHCYGRHGMFRCSPDVPRAHDRNLCATSNLDAFVDSAIAALAKWRAGSMLRIHSVGDFYSLDYFRAWLTIAANSPHIRFAAYTRMWRLGAAWCDALDEADDLANFTVWYSTDPTTGEPADPPRVSYILDPAAGAYSAAMPEPNCAKQNGASGGCRACGLCWDAAARVVTFRMH